MRNIFIAATLMAGLAAGAQAPPTVSLFAFERSALPGTVQSGSHPAPSVHYLVYAGAPEKGVFVVTRLWIYGKPYSFSLMKAKAPVTLELRNGGSTETRVLVPPQPGQSLFALQVGKALAATGFPSAQPPAVRIEYRYNGLRASKVINEIVDLGPEMNE